MLGKVTIIKVNNAQGDFNQPERVFLYIGASAEAASLHDIIPVSADSDLDTLFGEADSELKTQIAAARVNAVNPAFAAYALPIDPAVDTWEDYLYAALDAPSDLNVEAVVLCTPLESKAEVEACQTAANEVLSRFAKFVAVHGCVAGIDEATQTWADYLAAIGAYVDGVAADRVCVVPLLHGNDLGVVAGRLCNPAVTIADSPMRVATGPLVGLGDAPVDSAAAPLGIATVTAIEALRFSVAQWYSGYDGMYWADHRTLDAEAGDYQVYENLRVIDYLSRRVRILAIGRIADRRLNSTAKSIAFNKTYFARPLREASASIQIAGVEFPGICHPPEADAIAITWASQTQVKIAITARPYASPKQITVYLGLDLTTLG